MARRRTLGKKRKSQNTRGKKRGRTYRKMRRIRRAGVPEGRDSVFCDGRDSVFCDGRKEDLLILTIYTLRNNTDLLERIQEHIKNGADINKISLIHNKTPLDAINETIVNNEENKNPKKKEIEKFIKKYFKENEKQYPEGYESPEGILINAIIKNHNNKDLLKIITTYIKNYRTDILKISSEYGETPFNFILYNIVKNEKNKNPKKKEIAEYIENYFQEKINIYMEK